MQAGYGPSKSCFWDVDGEEYCAGRATRPGELFSALSAPPRDTTGAINFSARTRASRIRASRTRERYGTPRRSYGDTRHPSALSVRPTLLAFATLVLVAVSPCSVASAQRASDSLEIGFRAPPASARPRTWWHWTKSNVTKDGITKDLEWMKRVGIGGFQLADVDAGGGQTIDGRSSSARRSGSTR